MFSHVHMIVHLERTCTFGDSNRQLKGWINNGDGCYICKEKQVVCGADVRVIVGVWGPTPLADSCGCGSVCGSSGRGFWVCRLWSVNINNVPETLVNEVKLN